MKVLLLTLLLPCALLAAEEPVKDAGLRQRIAEAVEKQTPMVFGKGKVKRVITFIAWEQANAELQVIEPMVVFISDELKVGNDRQLITLHELRQQTKFYRDGVAAAGEKPVFEMVLWPDAADELIERAIIAMAPAGKSQLVALFPRPHQLEGYRLTAPIAKKPRAPRAHFICLVHDCQLCGRGHPLTIPKTAIPKLEDLIPEPEIEVPDEGSHP